MDRAFLDKLIADSYKKYQALFNHNRFHNHTPHHLAALYFLGASKEIAERVYEKDEKITDPYVPSPHEITRANWRESFGDGKFCQAYKDFFEKELTEAGGDWKNKLLQLLLEGDENPLIDYLVCGLVHPLIHTGYAFELDSLIVGAEAATLAAVCYSPLYKTINRLVIPIGGTKCLFRVFEALRHDDRLKQEPHNFLDTLDFDLRHFQDIVLSHFYTWEFDGTNLDKMIEQLFDFIIYFYGASHSDEKTAFHFIVLHLVTGMHALRLISLQLKDEKAMAHLIMQMAYFSMLVYVAAHRPQIRKSLIDDFKPEDSKNNWDYVLDRALNTTRVHLMHLVKVVYTLKTNESLYGSKNGFYLKTAIKTVDNVTYDETWLAGSDNPEFLASFKEK